MEWVFRDQWVSLKQANNPLQPRDNMVKFYVQNNKKDLEKNLKLQGCPSDLQYKVKEVVTDQWGVFCDYLFRWNIWGFSLQIDAGNHTPICCKRPSYGPREYEVMRKMVGQMDETFVVEEDDKPWGALAIIAAKPYQ